MVYATIKTLRVRVVVAEDVIERGRTLKDEDRTGGIFFIKIENFLININNFLRSLLVFAPNLRTSRNFLSLIYLVKA